MEEFFKKIYELLVNALTKRQSYEWKFFVFNGSEQNPQIKIANSIEYEFINSGNSIVIINDNFKLYPYWMGVEPVRAKFSTNKNEVDVSVYEYRFENVAAGVGVWGYIYTAVSSSNAFMPYDPTGNVAPYNLLQVIVKQQSAQ
jgi:hypothetical protein